MGQLTVKVDGRIDTDKEEETKAFIVADVRGGKTGCAIELGGLRN